MDRIDVGLVVLAAEESGAGQSGGGAAPIYVGLGVLALLTVLLVVLAMRRSRSWDPDELRGLALPRGSVRALLALWLIGGFLLFVFFGKDALTTTGVNGEEDTALFQTVLAALLTLTGSVTGFYFGARTGQNLDEDDEDAGGGDRDTDDGDGEDEDGDDGGENAAPAAAAPPQV